MIRIPCLRGEFNPRLEVVSHPRLPTGDILDAVELTNRGPDDRFGGGGRGRIVAETTDA